MSFNSGNAVIAAATPFNAANAPTYDESTSVVAYDSLGNANRVQLYFVQTARQRWDAYAQPPALDGDAQPRLDQRHRVGAARIYDAATLTSFTRSAGVNPGATPTPNRAWGNGAAASTINFDFTGTTLGDRISRWRALPMTAIAPGNYSGTTITASGRSSRPTPMARR